MTTKNIFSFLFLLLLSLCIFAQPNTNLGGSGVFSNFFNTNSNTDNEPCFEVLTEAAVKTLRDTGGLQVGCWYNFVVNDLGGGNVALKAVATNVLGEAGYFWSGITGSKAFDAIYDMDSGNLTYL